MLVIKNRNIFLVYYKHIKSLCKHCQNIKDFQKMFENKQNCKIGKQVKQEQTNGE